MQFNFKKPCNNCPFLKESLHGWLGEQRSTEISEVIVSGIGTFSCHKTTGVTRGIEIPQQNQSHCFGALQMLRNMNKLESGFIYQMAQRLLGAKFDHIKVDTSKVFGNQIEFIEHHT